jgi:hypothetical protein
MHIRESDDATIWKPYRTIGIFLRARYTESSLYSVLGSTMKIVKVPETGLHNKLLTVLQFTNRRVPAKGV